MSTLLDSFSDSLLSSGSQLVMSWEAEDCQGLAAAALRHPRQPLSSTLRRPALQDTVDLRHSQIEFAWC